MTGSKPSGLLKACFFVSGAVSLTAQVVWTRQLSMTLGSTTYAVATVLAVFMAGLALGAELFGRRAARLRNPLFAYGLMEGGVALWILATPVALAGVEALFRACYRSIGPDEGGLLWVRVLGSALFLLPPTLLMGGTLPVLCEGARREGAPDQAAGALYAVNTWGAAAGAFLAGFVLAPALGLKGALSVASLAGAAVLLAVMRAARSPGGVRGAEPDPGAAAPGDARSRWIFAGFLLTGFAALAQEVVWTRILVLHFGSAVYAFSLMLTLFLAGLAGGAAWGTRRAGSSASPARDLCAIAGVLAISVAVQIFLFMHLRDMLGAAGALLRPQGHAGTFLGLFLAAVPILLPPTFLMGATFPLGIAALREGGGADLGARVGRLYALNTVGTVAGAAAAGFIMIPWLGAQRSLVAAGAVEALAAVLFLRALPDGRRRAAWMPAAGMTAVVLALLYPDHAVLLRAGIFQSDAHVRMEVLHYAEDADATVTVERVQVGSTPPYGSISLNGVNVAGSSRDLFAIQKLQGHLPLLMAPGARDVLHIGFGSGGTARAVSLHPVERIDIAELTRAVPEASARFFPAINGGVLQDPRVHLMLCDGRNYVMATDRTYDVILSDSIHPRYAGNGSLYTREYFGRCRAHLRDQGILSMWLPFYSLREQDFKAVLAAFATEFPNCWVFYINSTINPYTIVVGRNGDGPLDLPGMERLMQQPGVAGDLAPIGVRAAEDLLDNLVMAGPEVGAYTEGVQPHTDDNLVVEYGSGRTTPADRRMTEITNLASLVAARRPPGPSVRFADEAGRERFLATRFAATSRALEGHLAAMTGDRARAAALFEEAVRIAPGDREPDDYFHSFTFPDLEWVASGSSPSR